MKTFLLSTAIAVLFGFAYGTTTYAACPEGPPNTFNCNTQFPNPDPDGIQRSGDPNNFIITVNDGAGIDTSLQPVLDDDGIELGDGNDMITIDGGSVIGQDGAIDARGGINTFTINDALLRGISDTTIRAGDDRDILTIENSLLTSVDNDILSIRDGGNNVVVRDSQLIVLTAGGTDSAISNGSGDDTILVEQSILQGGRSGPGIPTAISLGNGDDIVTLGTGADLRGVIDGGIIRNGRIACGNDFDTIIFAMQVPTNDLAEITDLIESADPAGDTIIINNLVYEWIDCEELVAQLEGGFEFPVPTLSQWGLFAMAAFLGIAGFMVVRRRQSTI